MESVARVRDTEHQRRIVLYGSSIVLASIGAGLERTRRFELRYLSPPLPSRAALEALAPDVVLFDIEAFDSEPAFALLEAQPGLLLLGVSSEGNLVRLWSGRQYSELSIAGLAALIEGAEPGTAPASSRALND
jgi:hypothetical protein